MKLLEKIKNKLKIRPLTPVKIILIFVLGLALSILVWYYLPEKRVSLQFWINEMFVIILIMVTAIYVYATYKLVEETQKLKPSGRLSIYFSIDEKMNFTTPSIDETNEKSIKVGGINKKDIRILVMEIRNVGDRMVDNLSLDIEINIPVLGFSKTEPYKYINGLKSGESIRIGIAKFHPLMSIKATAKNCQYSDGYDKYFGVGGNPWFYRGMETTEYQSL